MPCSRWTCGGSHAASEEVGKSVPLGQGKGTIQRAGQARGMQDRAERAIQLVGQARPMLKMARGMLDRARGMLGKARGTIQHVRKACHSLPLTPCKAAYEWLVKEPFPEAVGELKGMTVQAKKPSCISMRVIATCRLAQLLL
eukprot:scaffold175239_cov17-Tisochrysis_lutea.AAC.2